MKGIKNSILTLMRTMKMSAAEAMAALEIPASEQPKYAAMLQ